MITTLHRGGTAKRLQYYIGGGMPKCLQYYKGGEGSLGTPKSDYVICARLLILNCKRICRENSNYTHDESFVAIFATTERGQLLPPYRYLILVLMMVF